MRHINVKSLWLHEKELQKQLAYEKIEGEADGLTKHVRQELAEKYASAVSLRLSGDRAEGSLQLSGGGGKKQCGWYAVLLHGVSEILEANLVPGPRTSTPNTLYKMTYKLKDKELHIKSLRIPHVLLKTCAS